MQVYLDLALCPQALRTDRAIGDKSALCSDPRPLGRLVIGLYGDTAPGCVAAFTSLLGSGAYTGTTVNKIYPGRYIKAGKQGSKRYGEVDAVQLGMQDPAPANPDLVRPCPSALTCQHGSARLLWAALQSDTGGTESAAVKPAPGADSPYRMLVRSAVSRGQREGQHRTE